jgi:hypothetical protein
MSQFIKNKYFSQYKRIIISQNLQFSNLKYGINNIYLNENINIKINIVGSNSFNFYNVMRIIQTLLGSIMLFVGIYVFIQLRKINIIPLIILVLFGSMALYNGLTSTCSMSVLLKNYLN